MELVEHNARKIVPCLGAAVGFNITLLAWQGAGKLCKISCATPVAGSVLGGLAVASASVVAAQLANVAEAFLENKRVRMISKDSVVLHAAFGLVVFKALGGQYKNVMPSNLVYPGALARQSLPAKGSRYASDGEAQVIKEMFETYGCHHCGSRKGMSIADHMPPNIVVKNRMAEATSKRLGFFHRAAILVVRRLQKLRLQRFYPQCVSCMQKQSAALRHGKSKLVYHFRVGFPEPPYFTGFFVSAVKLDTDETEGL